MKYTPSSKGLSELGKSAQMGAVCRAAAQQIASAANGMDPAGAYKAEGATVLVGKKNEPRAGARVMQTRYSPAKNRALKQASKG